MQSNNVSTNKKCFQQKKHDIKSNNQGGESMLHFTSIEEFTSEWQSESGSTRKIFEALTDESLHTAANDDHRTLGRIAWHIIQTIPEMAGRTGLTVDGPSEKDAVPQSADIIKQTYDKTATSLLNQISTNWQDAILDKEDDMYGEQWKRGQTLAVLLKHEIHHRAQMTVLMRQAGLKVPGVYGPSKEEWDQYGVPAPEI